MKIQSVPTTNYRRLRSSEGGTSLLKSSNNSPWIPRKYLCADCGRIFGIRASLMRHRAYECVNNQPQSHSEATSQPTITIKRERPANRDRQSGTTRPSMSNARDRPSMPTMSKSKRKHNCAKCHKSYAFFTSLWRHQNYECGIEPRFNCTVCTAKFAQKSNLDRHVRARHMS